MTTRIQDLLASLRRRLWPEEKVLPDLGYIVDGTGWKVARLHSPKKAIFRGLAHGEYQLTGQALCQYSIDHLPPVHRCGCGFYAHRRRAEAMKYLGERRGLVLLRVELYGEIVVHTRGIRAAEQDVVGVYLPGRCTSGSCVDAVAGITIRRRAWVGRCARHFGRRYHTIDELRQIWGVEVGLC